MCTNDDLLQLMKSPNIKQVNYLRPRCPLIHPRRSNSDPQLPPQSDGRNMLLTIRYHAAYSVLAVRIRVLEEKLPSQTACLGFPCPTFLARKLHVCCRVVLHHRVDHSGLRLRRNRSVPRLRSCESFVIADMALGGAFECADNLNSS